MLLMKFINNIEQINDTAMYVTKYTRKEIEEKLDSSSNSITQLTSNINELNELTGNLKTKVTSMEGKLDKILNVLSTNSNPNIKL